MTNKEKKKAKIKQIILKICNVLCYIGTALLVLILIIVGVQSCNQKQPNNNVNNVVENQLVVRKKNIMGYSNNTLYGNYEDYNFYKFKYGDGTRISVTDQQYICEFAVDCNTLYSLDTPDIYHFLFWNEEDLPVYIFHDSYGQCQLYRLFLLYHVFEVGSNKGYMRLASINGDIIVNGEHVFITLLSKQNDVWNNYYYDLVDSDMEIIADKGYDFYKGDGIEYLYEEHKPSRFLFNKAFNYNAPFKSNINSVYGTTSSFTSVSAYGAYIDYDVGYFISNGMTFNKIRIHYYNSAWVLVNNEVVQMPSDNYTYAMLEYRNTDIDSVYAVNVRDTIPYNINGGSTTYFANSSTWYNDAFREILFMEDLSSDLSIKINAFNNNNQNSVNGYIGAGDVTDVFTLVGSAFTAWLPVMNISILPGITLGILIFIPLVATLVFAIIRIIKK